MYIDHIISDQGNVRLISDNSISNASYDRDISSIPYNIKANDLLLLAISGNIENVNVDLSGTLSAYAGFQKDSSGNWTVRNANSSVQVTQISKQFDKNKIKEAEESGDPEKLAELLAEIGALKDLQITQVMAPYMIINSERSILNANNGLVNFVGGELNLSAITGSIGSQGNAITVELDNALSAYAKDSVYIRSEKAGKNLNIKEIMSYRDKERETDVDNDNNTNEYYPLNVVSLYSAGGIVDASDDYITIKVGKDEKSTKNESPNILARTIILETGDGDIGVGDNALDIHTYSGGDGLIAKANGNVYISSLYDTNIKNITSTGNIRLVAQNQNTVDAINYTPVNKTLTIENVQAGGYLDVTAGNLNVTGKAEVAKNTEIKVENAVKVNDAELNTATINGKTIEITNAHASGDIALNSTGSTVINNATFDSNLTVTAGSFDVTGKLTSTGDVQTAIANAITINDADLKTAYLRAKDTVIQNMIVSDDITINSTNSTLINNATLDKNLNLISNKATVNEMQLKGNLNGKIANELDVKTSHDLNLGEITGLTKNYVDKVSLSSQKSIKNGASDSTTNISVANLNIKAGESIGEASKNVNINLPDRGGVIDIASNDDIYISLTGGPARFTNINTNNLVMNLTDNLIIEAITADMAKVKTTASKISLKNGDIKSYGEFYTNDKFLVVENRTLAPRMDATLQFFVKESPLWFEVNSSNNIITNKANVTRYNQGIQVNDNYEISSMNSAVNNFASNSILNAEYSSIGTPQKMDYRINAQINQHINNSHSSNTSAPLLDLSSYSDDNSNSSYYNPVNNKKDSNDT